MRNGTIEGSADVAGDRGPASIIGGKAPGGAADRLMFCGVARFSHTV